MKKVILILIASLLYISVNAQQTWQWVKTTTNGGASAPDWLVSVTCTDNFGHIYLAGSFNTDSIIIGAITLHLDNNALAEIFIIKYDINGNVLWAKSSGGIEEYVESIATDLSGNIFLSGIFMGDTAKFDTINLFNSGRPLDIFLAKYDSSGNVLWALAPNGTFQDGTGSIATDTNNNVYMTGGYQNSIIFDTDTLNSVNPYDDIFLFKFDPSGNYLWAKSFGGGLDDDGLTVCTDIYNNVYITGEFASDSISFGNFTLQNRYQITSSFYAPTDIYLAKLTADGQILWAKDFGGRQNEQPAQVITDAIGNVYLTGWYESDTMYFGTISFININDDTTQKIFLIKCDSSGNVLWAKSGGTQGNDQDAGYYINIDNTGNVYLTGYFSSDSIIFDSHTINNHNSNGNSDFFMTKYDATGNILWSNDIGGTGSELGNSMCMDSYGNIYLSGYFTSDSIELSSLTLDNNINNNYQVFLAKLGLNTGIGELQKTQQPISLYPNPTNSTITLRLPMSIVYCQLSIDNLLGEQLQNQFITNNSSLITQIDVSTLPPGIYFYQIIGEREIYRGKFIKEE